MRLTRALAPAALAAMVSAEPAAARDLWKSDDETSLLEVHGFYKNFGHGLAFPDGLVDGSEALGRLLGQTSLPDGAALSTNVVRLWGRAAFSERLELSVGWQAAATIASDPALAGGFSPGATVPSGAGQGAQRRLVDFDPTLVSERRWRLVHDLDLLALKWTMPFGEIVAGRQVLSWGTGRFWNPTDLLSPFAPTDVDKEVRHGVDALRLTLRPSSTSLIDLLWLPQRSAADNGGVARFQVNLLGYDFSLSAAKYVSDVVAGADFAGDVGPIGVHGEAAYTWGLTGLGTSGPVAVGDRYLRAVVGADWKPVPNLFLSGEYYFNGYGASDPSGYLARLTSARVASGQVFGAGRHYLGLAGTWKATELLSISLSAIVNLQDPSTIVVPVLEYWFQQSAILRIGAYGPIGRAPDPSALQRLTQSDVSARSPAFIAATSSLGFQSEYGVAPVGAFIELGIYF
jgi:hypothetical protein